MKKEKYFMEVFTDKNFKNINSFLVYSENGDAILFNCWVGIADKLNKFIKKKKLNLRSIFINHGLYEYINGIDKVYFENNEPDIYIGKEDLKNLYDSELNLSAIYNNVENYSIGHAINKITIISDDSQFNIGGIEINAYPRISQTFGSVIFVIKKMKVIFPGSALFCFKRTYAFNDLTVEEWDKTMVWVTKKFSKKFKLMPSYDEFDFKMKEVIKNNLFLRETLKLSKKKKKSK